MDPRNFAKMIEILENAKISLENASISQHVGILTSCWKCFGFTSNLNFFELSMFLCILSFLRKLYQDDKREANSLLGGMRDRELSDGGDPDYALLEGDFDVDNPQDLFKKVHDQALEDGYINELSAVLKNLVVLPSSAERAWFNVSRMVAAACKPVQQEQLQKEQFLSPQTRERMETTMSMVGGIARPRQRSTTPGATPEPMYPTYDQLHTMLEIRGAEEESIQVWCVLCVDREFCDFT